MTPDDRKLNDGQKVELYTALLRGIANEAQDRLCVEDRSHAWGPWVRSVVKKDLPSMGASSFAANRDETFRVRADRVCLNCGKEQHDVL
jgi:hypothetical protein